MINRLQLLKRLIAKRMIIVKLKKYVMNPFIYKIYFILKETGRIVECVYIIENTID